MSEIKEYTKKKTPEKSIQHTKNTPPIHPIYISIIVFSVIFLVDLFLMHKITNTSIVFSCVLLVLQVVIAVALDHMNYAVLLGLAILELIVGLILHHILLVFLTLFVYFAGLYVIHTIRTTGGLKRA